MNDQINHSFDKEAVYEEQLKPVLDTLKQICREHQIPMIVAVVYKCEDTTKMTDSYFDSRGTAGQDNWLPEELLMCGAIIQKKLKALPLAALSVLMPQEAGSQQAWGELKGA